MYIARKPDGTNMAADEVKWGDDTSRFTCPNCGYPVAWTTAADNTVAHYQHQVRSPKPYFRHTIRHGKGPECSVVLKRLIKEVEAVKPNEWSGGYNRTYHRHNR